VGRYINGQAKIDEAVGKFQNDYERALRAEQAAGRGDIVTALDMWAKVFYEPFPAYG
jgi:hypothetical protein